MNKLFCTAGLFILGCFSFYFPVRDIRNGYFKTKYTRETIDRNDNPIRFWTGIVIQFIVGTVLIIYGVLVLLGKVTIRNRG